MAELSTSASRAALCSVLVCILVGCASPVSPAPPVLEAKALSLQSLAQSPAFARGNWWQGLQEPALNKLLEQALAAHPRLTLASAREAGARARQAIAASAHGPFVSANASWNRQRYSSDALVPPPIAGSWQNLSELGLSLDYRFDVWGRVRERVTAAAGAQAAAHLQQDSARLWLQSEVVSQFVQWRAAQQELALAQEALRLSESLARQDKTLKRAGLVSLDALSERDAMLAARRSDVSAAQSRLLGARAALGALTLSDAASLDALPAAALPLWPIETAGLTLNQIAPRAELRAARFQMEGAAAQVRAARADFYPDISLSALIGLSTLSSATLFDARSRGLALTPAISLPLFQAGALQGALDLQQAAYAEAIASYNQTLLDIARESATALASQQGALHAESDARLGERAAQALAASAQLRQRAGLAPASEPLQAGLTLVDARLGLVQAHRARLMAQTALVRAMGSGALDNTFKKESL